MIDLDNLDHTFVIAEAGSNWKKGSYEDDLKQAKEMIIVAAKSGADAIKFQTFRSKTVYASNAGTTKYLEEHGIKENINEIFAKHEMPYEMIPQLAEYCKQNNILFMSSPFSIEDAKHIDPYVQIHKIASYEINHIRLLEYLAECKKPLLISTGASNYTDIDFVVELLKEKNAKFVLLQCTAKYPAPIDTLNLTTIPEMRTRYNVSIGLSDHSTDPLIAPLISVGLGANIIEKHFTLDRNLPGPDHRFALIPSELKLMIKSIRLADVAKGNSKKTILDEEQDLRQFATRSIQAIKDISKDEVLQEGINFDVLRPGNKSRGAEARFLKEINRKKSGTDVKIGEGVTNYY